MGGELRDCTGGRIWRHGGLAILQEVWCSSVMALREGRKERVLVSGDQRERLGQGRQDS